MNNMYWMNYTIDISKKFSQSVLRVGAVLVDEKNQLICSAFSEEENNAQWCSTLLNKLHMLKHCSAQSVYITINTLSDGNSFDLIRLLNEVNVFDIFIGLPDPALTCYLKNDPVISPNCNIHRYPDELQKEILKQNKWFFEKSEQNIKCIPYYSENRISSLVEENLAAQGFIVSKNELNENKNKTALARLLCDKYGIEYSNAFIAVCNAISDAFKSKYTKYSYSDDARSLSSNWKEDFYSFCMRSSISSMSTIKILNVGVGSGNEARILFSNCPHITFVDIVQSSLEKIKEQIPTSEIVVSSADNLSSVPNKSYDLYVSLRTFNSSFFNVAKAITEAHRVLTDNGVIIISVANGFLNPEINNIIPGLIIPGTEFVDIYRGIDIANQIRLELLQAGFKNIQWFYTKTEIFLSAIIA